MASESADAILRCVSEQKEYAEEASSDWVHQDHIGSPTYWDETQNLRWAAPLTVS